MVKLKTATTTDIQDYAFRNKITTTREAIKLLQDKRGFNVDDIKKFNWRVSDEEFVENMTDEQLIDFANHQASEVEE